MAEQIVAEEILRNLEVAGQIIWASPALVSAQQRQTAENVFLQFHKIASSYQLCQQILELSTTDYILFETVKLLKTAVIREWSKISVSDLTSVRQYLMHYVINKPSLAPFVMAKILEVIAVIIKRSSIVEAEQERIQGLHEIVSLVKNGDLPKQILGCSMLTAIIREYVMYNKTSTICLPLGVHYQEKVKLQENYLKIIFELCIQMLTTLIEKDFDEPVLLLVKHVLILTDDVLDWEYIDKDYRDRSRFYFLEDDSKIKVLILPICCQDIMLNPATLDLFFTLYCKVRSNSELAHHARNCLIRLACYEGKVEPNEYKKIGIKYLDDYMQRFVRLLSNIDIIDREASAIIDILNAMHKNHLHDIWNIKYLPRDLVKTFWEQLQKLTCLFMEGAVKEESMCVNNSLWEDALKRIMKLWPTFSHVFPTELYEQSCIEICNMYVQYHLSPPEGKRGSSGNKLNKEAIYDHENDNMRYMDQLEIFGIFACEIPHHFLPFLTRLLEERIYRIYGRYIYKIIKLHENVNLPLRQNRSASPPVSMIDLYKDLHFLILITGYFLGGGGKTSDILIPQQLLRYSREQFYNSNVDMNRTLEFLISSEIFQSEINVSIDSIDPVIRLTADVYGLCAIEKKAISANFKNILSPELSSTLMWFLRKTHNIYFLPGGTYYGEMFPTIRYVFGIDRPGSSWSINFLLEKIISNINAFQSEQGIIEETMKLLIAVSKMRKEAIRLLKPEGVAYIVDLAPNIPYVYPRIVKRGLMRTVVRINAAMQDTSIQEHYWSKTLKLLQNRWEYLVLNSNFESSHHEGDIKIQIIHLLESFIGAIQGGGQASIAYSVHRYTYLVLAELPKLLFLYRNCPDVVQLILELFCEYAKKILCYLSITDATPVYDIYSKAMQMYVDYNRDRVSVDETAKEDICNDILLFIKLYNHLLDKKDFYCEEEEEDEEEEPNNWSEGYKNYPPIEKFLSLLGILIPMIDRNLLQFPSLCLQYYEMLLLLCYSVAPKMYKLSSSNKKVVEQLLATVVLGLHTFSLDVSNNCNEIIRVFCEVIFEARICTGLPKNEIMVPFLNLILDSVLSHQIHLSLVSVIGEILYFLVFCYQEEYFKYVHITLSNYKDEQIVEMLKNAFNELITDIDWNLNDRSYCERVSRDLTTFKTNFKNFLPSVQGLLMTK